ncbi:O-succinylbenzoic acid--CoA ligase [Algoriphagus aquaeductus]|uniref:O-succinylbenzoic acid--CoA ligase n=1 Tax=Algoriphagus aquaeductus TaxID=475299 RepID=A0A326RQD1_9BACT|nr:AMP-binding protein [Algoriphagus aquaeductus]PZV82223.1 O-succinylbenzoic acid--CoA ligase [Algoriphagus aquaeductus]
MFRLHFENQVYSKAEDFEVNPNDLPEFAQAAFSFCKRFLEGEKTFSQSTSGSTGIPKQISISRLQIEASAKGTGSFFKTDSDSKLLCCLNPAYIAGKMMLVRAMVWNSEIHLVEPSSNPLSGVDGDFDFVAMVPLQVQASLKDERSLQKLKSIQQLIIGGAPISSKLKANLVENGIKAWQTFGMTETVSHIALAEIGNKELLYQTLPGVEIGQDSRGALWIKSEMSGPSPIQTNDLIELRSETSFVWLGRVDFVVNSGGIKLFPELIEQKAEEVIQELFPGISFFFIGEKEDALGEKLVLFLETLESSSRVKILKERLSDVLGKYELPKKIYFSPKFVRTESGKINRLATFNTL